MGDDDEDFEAPDNGTTVHLEGEDTPENTKNKSGD